MSVTSEGSESVTLYSKPKTIYNLNTRKGINMTLTMFFSTMQHVMSHHVPRPCTADYNLNSGGHLQLFRCVGDVTGL